MCHGNFIFVGHRSSYGICPRKSPSSSPRVSGRLSGNILCWTLTGSLRSQDLDEIHDQMLRPTVQPSENSVHPSASESAFRDVHRANGNR